MSQDPIADELRALRELAGACLRPERTIEDWKRWQTELSPTRLQTVLEPLEEDHGLVEWMEGLATERGRRLVVDSVERRFACSWTFRAGGGIDYRWFATLREAWGDCRRRLLLREDPIPPPGGA